MIVIGITGTLGAGKGTIVDYLVKKKNFVHFSVRNFILKEIYRQGLEPNRDSMVVVANELRKKYGPAYIIEELYKEANRQDKDSIIESIRTPGEIEALRKTGKFYLFAVDADPAIRYSRIVSRASETDHVSFEEFLANEQREMSSDDPNKQNLSRCIAMADFVFNNNGTIEELENNVEKVINGIKRERE